MKHTMKLSEPYYSLVKKNEKTVEIRGYVVSRPCATQVSSI